MKIIKGKSVLRDIAIGKIFVLDNTSNTQDHGGPVGKEAWDNFLKAKLHADDQLEKLFESTKKILGEEQAMIIDTQRLMLDDGDFIDSIKSHILSGGMTAVKAVGKTGVEFAEMFSSMDDEYMKARSLDVEDITKRITKILLGESYNIELSEPSILIAEDLTPSETVSLDRDKILAFVTRKGSMTSHTAILANILNIPSLIQTPVEISESLNGKTAIVDGIEGDLYIDPDQETLDKFRALKDGVDKERHELDKYRNLSTETKAGKKIDLFANIGNPEDIDAVLESGAEGIGLFRSEFLYLEHFKPPTEDEQFSAYSKVAKAMGDKQVIIRTLDIGADKQVDYLNLEEEENPALGYRAIRICLDNIPLFKTQLRAIYRASAFGNVAIMFPMIASVWELKEAKAIVAEVKQELTTEKIAFGNVEMGIMIETPAAVIIADDLAKEADFFSVGTNDLTQYTIAVDRQSFNLQRYYDPYHPAIVKMLGMVADSAIRNGIWAGICGELAADLKMTETFLEMGYSELSVSPAHLLKVRQHIRNL